MARLAKRHIEKIKSLRQRLWPDLDDNELWYRKAHDGFTTIPRTLPLVMAIIDDLSKGAPASSTYFELWCRAYDEMYISLANQDQHAHCAGFSGQRARRTWQERIRRLAELGFIRVSPGTSGEFSHAAIVNPHVALRRLWVRKEPGLTHQRYVALIERGNEVGAPDIDRDPKEPKLSQLNDDIPF